MKKYYKLLMLLLAFFIIPTKIYAHCPLCTIGAGVVAGGATILGVTNMAIGVFIGAFSVSIGVWFSKIIKKKFISFQNNLIILISYLTTIIPILVFFPEVYGLYIPYIGNYGYTLLINKFLIGSIIGSVIFLSTPFISKKITKIRNGKIYPFQGIILTILLLIIVGTIIQFFII